MKTIQTVSALMCAAIFALSPLDADTIPACPSMVSQGFSFPAAPLYSCTQSNAIWFGFEDIGAETAGMSALPSGTIIHMDSVTPDFYVVTIEPGDAAQFAPGAVYSWRYEIAQTTPGMASISAASADYGAEGTAPSLSSSVASLNVTYTEGGTPLGSPGSALGTITVTNGAIQQLDFVSVVAVSFTDTLSGIGMDTTIQSISNTILEAMPEPAPASLTAVGLMALCLAVRKRI